MSTSVTIPLAFFAVAAIVLLFALVCVLVQKRTHDRHAKAAQIRENAREETLQVNRREALAEETAAKARAAQADADVKAAQASGLEQQAAAHRSEAKSSRDRLDEQWKRADGLDPTSQTPDTAKSAHRK